MASNGLYRDPYNKNEPTMPVPFVTPPSQVYSTGPERQQSDAGRVLNNAATGFWARMGRAADVVDAGNNGPVAPLQGRDASLINMGLRPHQVAAIHNTFNDPAPADAPPPQIPVAPKLRAATPADVATSLGEQRLQRGVSRFNDPMVPGVYAARSNDGSLSFSNVTGPNGLPQFAGAGVDPRGLRRSGLAGRSVASNVGAAQGAWKMGPDPDAPDAVAPAMAPASGAQNAALFAQMTGGVVQGMGPDGKPLPADPRAGYTYAQNSLRANVPALIAATQGSPQEAQNAVEQLKAATKTNPNSADPDVRQSDLAALAQLQGSVSDTKARALGAQSPFGVPSAPGAPGAVPGRGGLSFKDAVALQQHQEKLRLQTQQNAAAEQHAKTTEERQKAALEEQQANNFLNRYNTALVKTPDMADMMVAQAVPQGLSPAKFGEWLDTPKGVAWSQALQTSLQRGAQNSLKTPLGMPVEWGDRNNLGANVNFGNMVLDKNGKFQGFYDDGDAASRTNEYPRTSGLWGSNNYNESLLKSIPNMDWKVLQQHGLRRMQPAASQ